MFSDVAFGAKIRSARGRERADQRGERCEPEDGSCLTTESLGVFFIGRDTGPYGAIRTIYIVFVQCIPVVSRHKLTGESDEATDTRSRGVTAIAQRADLVVYLPFGAAQCHGPR